ncbi:hypothetical protein DPMN_133322 [Dreissena polymorpha]|uniref:Uncharacterized protein n=1 Tax=Dreissena polymorpha TaxID=45954 RepID=A0A9D4FTC4_DREPO|nr:hypothetical protein DPMN_133322 [Dreissena polymorpha]
MVTVYLRKIQNTAGDNSVDGGFSECVSASCSATFQTVTMIGGEKCMTCILNQIQDASNIVSK